MISPVIVLGADVNALVAANVLARGGRRVLVVARKRSEHDPVDNVGWVPPHIMRGLALDARGLRLEQADPWISVPLPQGGRLDLWHDMQKSVDAIRRVSPGDAERWPEFCRRMRRISSILERLYVGPPPDILSSGFGELRRLGSLSWFVRRMGRQAVEDVLRVLPMSVAELLDDWFECDALKAAIGAAGVHHLCQGPRSGGTAFVLLHHHVGSPPGVFRPPRSNIAHVLRHLAGIERRDADAVHVITRDGVVTGVVLDDGEEIATSLVLSALDPKQVPRLAADSCFEPEFLRALRNLRQRGVVAHVTLTLDRQPGFGTIVLAPSLPWIERAYEDAKYGRMSTQPLVEAVTSVPDNGRVRVHAHVQYAPYAPAAGQWNDSGRQQLAAVVLQMLAKAEPGVEKTITETTVQSPVDLEQAFGWPAGQAYHAELTLDQILFMRPVAGWARYRTPLRGLWLCGRGTHPGGMVGGAIAARFALVAGPPPENFLPGAKTRA